MFSRRLTSVIAFGHLALMVPTNAQDIGWETAQDVFDLERFAFAPGISVSPDIPTPESYLGYELGTQYTLYTDVVGYIRAVTEASDRISMHEYARTYEDRPLHYLIITSPNNHARIETIRENNLKLADPSLSAAEASDLISSQPVIPWLSYNVHGNEPSSTEAAMQVIYQLAANQDAATLDLLDAAV
ncbi:MAG: M14 family zinc carboxypeptidase, partial [Bacteroidetes bacterium]|nr:M14 family zinc carboxypeptidase [Bacteroidota bacterium]